MKTPPTEVTLIGEDIVSQELSDAVSDYLSDYFGFCHKGFNIEVKATNIKWDMSE